MEGEQRGRTDRDEAIATKMLRKNKSFTEIHDLTDLPFERIKQLADKIFS